MAEINYLEIIQNKLDALVEKIVQKENSDEDFRITYAQILEKINTKMDIFSNDDTTERINLVGIELGKLIRERQEVVDSKFNAIKGEFDNINDILSNSLKTPEIIAAFDKIQNQIHYFSEEQESQKFAFNSIISHIEKFGTLEETNENIRANFAIVKEQNTIINENVNKQLDILDKLNTSLQETDKKILDDLNTLIASLKEFLESFNEDVTDIKQFVDDKVEQISAKINEADTVINALNNNFTTLMQVIGNIFEDDAFQEVRSNITDIIAKTVFISEAIAKLATKEELLANSEKNKEEIKQDTKKNIEELGQKLLSSLDFSSLEDIKNYTEKMFFQGTEVLKEEIWSIKDKVNNLNEESLKKDEFEKKLDEIKIQNTNAKEEIDKKFESLKEQNDTIKDDLTDIISEESVATSTQLVEISTLIESLKNNLADIVLKQQQEQIDSSLKELQTKFVTQLVQIADNISFEEELGEISNSLDLCSEEIKEKISSDINEIKEEILQLKDTSETENRDIFDVLTTIDSAVKTDISQDLKTLLSGLKLLTSGMNEDKEYVYTLPDIESDLSKIRQDIGNIQKTLAPSEQEAGENSIDLTSKINSIKKVLDKLQDNPLPAEIAEIKALFDSLNEDVSSISKRTNKLIIASDEVSKALKANIIAFTSLINEFEKQSREFYDSAFMKEIHARIESMSQNVSSILQSEQLLNEAFMYMGEWIDSASDSFDEIKTDVSKVKKSLLSDDINFADKIENTVNDLTQKIAAQDTKIEMLDEKLNQIISQQQESKEIKSLLEYITSQISITNEKIVENEKLSQKIADIEKQIKRIDKNVTAITEYIDDEEDSGYFDEEDTED